MTANRYRQRAAIATAGDRLHERPRSNCGVGAVVDLQGRASHGVVQDALDALERMDHRGARGADPNTGDGAGVLLRKPDALLREHLPDLPSPDRYGVAQLFLPRDADIREALCERVEAVTAAAGFRVHGWRSVPVDSSVPGPVARESEPAIAQLFVAHGDGLSGDELDAGLFLLRRRLEQAIRRGRGPGTDVFHVCSLDRRQIVYKGMLTNGQLRRYFADLREPALASHFALVHARFSTNTLGAWPLAQPCQGLVHNGEINTYRGNLNRMRAREGRLEGIGGVGALRALRPLVTGDGSDSVLLDDALELLRAGGRTLPHALRMLIPPAWESDDRLPQRHRDWYDYHGLLMEPWDGPALVAATDGERVAAVLDRNGFRPCRYQLTADDRLLLASEAGVLDVPSARVRRQGRLGPGEILLADPDRGVLVDGDGVIDALPDPGYGDWLRRHRVRLSDRVTRRLPAVMPAAERERRQHLAGYTLEDLERLVRPMTEDGADPVGAMGDDTPPGSLAHCGRRLHEYFRQLFAQVSNPAIDYLREALVTTLTTHIGPQGNLLDGPSEQPGRVRLDSPVLGHGDLEALRGLADRGLPHRTLDLTFTHREDMAGALERLLDDADIAVDEGIRLLVLSDRSVDTERLPLPALLAGSALHQHLMRSDRRGACALIVEAGDVCTVHHLATVLGYGVDAVHPYLGLASAEALANPGTARDAARENYRRALEDGLRKVMARLGIATLESYKGAQLFEALGLDGTLVDRHFTGTASRLGGIGLGDLEADIRERREALAAASTAGGLPLPVGGALYWRRDGEHHDWNPDTLGLLQAAVRGDDESLYRGFSRRVDEPEGSPTSLRGLLEILPAGPPVPLDEVEPVAAITRRFFSGAMSLGALSPEAHETLAIGMNRVGGVAHSGEGGEQPDRLGTERECRNKQVASGRFGVTARYLAGAAELEIKIAQGAKPGEGGQLPGHKVDRLIARLRHTVPGVGLISPPPHHDIYSIEDLAQLIHDLRCINPVAEIQVKLVASPGVGTIAAGVAKAGADAILIAGDSGGTGAAVKTSIKSVGLPWELGLSDTQRVLVDNGLRSRVWLRVDGGLKTGRDVLVAGLMGAERFGFGMAALVTIGCIMLRKCHCNTCSVGIATQDPELRRRFPGRPEHVVRYLRFVAGELREHMAALGFRRVDELVGRMDCLRQCRTGHARSDALALGSLIRPPAGRDAPRRMRSTTTADPPERRMGLLAALGPAFDHGDPVVIHRPVSNIDRSLGARMSAELLRCHPEGLPTDTVRLVLEGTAGQSLGAFLAPGLQIAVTGAANDYVGKGLSGGRISICPPGDAAFARREAALIGNVALYGATAGELYVGGGAGERFAVRNSGALAVVEGVGDHACEYMTGGLVLVLGRSGRNLGAGMTGGSVVLLDDDDIPRRTVHADAGAAQPLADAHTRAVVEALLRNHQALTGSDLAAALLADWPASAGRLVRYSPERYRTVVEQALAEGEDLRPPIPAPVDLRRATDDAGIEAPAGAGRLP